jgi:hypothetical protein
VKATVICTAMVVAALTGCSAGADVADTPTVSRETLQTDIADRLSEAGDPPQSVTCHEDLVGELGRTARCDVAMSATNGFQPIATVTRVDGTTVDYELTPALSQAQLEKAVTGLVAEAVGDRVESVACESGLAGKVDATAHCDVDAGGVKGRRTVRVTDVSGLTMNFNLTSG